jgi:beta-hydroxylase
VEFLNRRFSLLGAGPIWFAGEELPWLREMEAAAGDIAKELATYRREGGWVPPIDATSPGASSVYGNTTWDMLHLYLVGRRIDRVCRFFPQTLRVLEAMPDLRHAKFSVLGADRHHVPRHRDGFNGVLRMHLALDVPKGDCFMKVNGERVDWRAGRAFVFDPGCVHEVFKEAAEPRTVLIADFIRPTPAWVRWNSVRVYAELGRRPEVEAVYRKYGELFALDHRATSKEHHV